MSRRTIKAINWSYLAERIPERERAAYVAFKAKSDKYMQRMTANPETAPKIDWAFYKKNIPIAGLVDKFQKGYESFTVPYPVDKYTSEVEAQEKEMLVLMEKFIEDSNKRIKSSEAEIERIKNLIPIAEMTMEDFRDLYPDEAIDAYNRPTIWPHTPEFQPENDPGHPPYH